MFITVMTRSWKKIHEHSWWLGILHFKGLCNCYSKACLSSHLVSVHTHRLVKSSGFLHLLHGFFCHHQPTTSQGAFHTWYKLFSLRIPFWLGMIEFRCSLIFHNIALQPKVIAVGETTGLNGIYWFVKSSLLILKLPTRIEMT